MTTCSATLTVMAAALTPYGVNAVVRYALAWSSLCHAVDRTGGRNWALMTSPAAESLARLVKSLIRAAPCTMTCSREAFRTLAGARTATFSDQAVVGAASPVSAPRDSQGFVIESRDA